VVVGSGCTGAGRSPSLRIVEALGAVGGVDQEVVEQLRATEEQMRHPGAGQAGFCGLISAAAHDGPFNFGQFAADVAHHLGSGFAG